MRTPRRFGLKALFVGLCGAALTAADWFNGVDPDPISNLPVRLITRETVNGFFPPQF